MQVQFSLRTMLLLVVITAIAVSLGQSGGWPWFAFIVTASLCGWLLWLGFQWAVYGTGVWPTGVTGRVLYLVLVPVLVVALFGVAWVLLIGIVRLPQLGWLFGPLL